MGYALLLLTVVTTVAGQLLIKTGMAGVGAMPTQLRAAITFLLQTTFTNGFVLGGLVLAVISSMTYLAALTRLRLSVAYPVMALTYVLVFLGAGFLLGEHISAIRWAGIIVVCAGVALAGKE